MSKKHKDPFYKREKEKYQIPIPSREFILQILNEYGRPISLNRLHTMLEIENEEQEALNFRLKAMMRDGQLMQDRRGRFCLLKKINLRRGTIQGHPDGYGFFIPEDGSDDLMLSPREMQAVMHTDLVLAYQSGVDRRGRPEGKIHEIIEHTNKNVVGRFFIEHDVGFVVPDNKRLSHDITIPLNFAGGAESGEVVLVELIAYPSIRNQAIGKVVHVLGAHMAPGMEIEVAIFAHAIPWQWPEEVLTATSKIPQNISEGELKNRTDLRHLPFVTIDGEDAKDFDDAVYCSKTPKGSYKLYVAIADVSHYVQQNSVIDLEAAKRGNSVYFPGKVVPMLPEALSNGICSLNPNVDRLCITAEMTITASGKISSYLFYRAVFKSYARLTYNKVGEWLKDNKCDDNFSKLWPQIENLYNVYKLLNVARKNRGAVDFSTTETYIEFDDQRKIKRIVPIIRNEAHRLIEECMLAANVSAAHFLAKAKIPILYRVHPSPDETKINALRIFLGELGLQLGGGKKPHPKDFQQVLQNIEHRPERHLIETVMLRSLKQAEYTETNLGHFGLAYPAYTHFTSPIRRYPDLLIHRAINHLIDNKPSFAYSEEEICRFGRACSITERRADEATREAVSWLKCEYMQDKVGEIFTGRISGVTGFGIFVELEKIYVEGLVHITSLTNDYYTFDPVKHRLIGERSGTIYRLGDQMQVLVARVDLDEKKIDFEPVGRDKLVK